MWHRINGPVENIKNFSKAIKDQQVRDKLLVLENLLFSDASSTNRFTIEKLRSSSSSVYMDSKTSSLDAEAVYVKRCKNIQGRFEWLVVFPSFEALTELI